MAGLYQSRSTPFLQPYLDPTGNHELMSPFTYEPREVEYCGVLKVRDHRFKLYTLRAPSRTTAALPPEHILRRMLEVGLMDLAAESDHKVGFVILHWGGDGDYLLINTWHEANLLRSSVFRVNDYDPDQPKLTSLAALRVVACVWEFQIHKFERDAWVREVLKKRPESLAEEVLEPYFAAGLRGMV